MGASKSKATSGTNPWQTLTNGEEVKKMIDEKHTFVLFVTRPDSSLVDVQRNALDTVRGSQTPIYEISIHDLRKNPYMHWFLDQADSFPYGQKQKPILFRWNQGTIRVGCGPDIQDLVGGGFGGITGYVNGQWK